MVNLKRGHVVWVNLDPTIGSEIRKKRPCVIVSNDAANLYFDRITLLPITSKKLEHIESFQVFLPASLSGLSKDSKILAEQIRTVSKKRVDPKPVTLLFDELLEKIDQALKIHLDIKNS